MNRLCKWALVALLPLVMGCAGTKAAYQAAEGLEETAKVASEHYYAVLVQLNAAKDAGTLSGAALARAQSAVRVAGPAIEQLRSASEIYTATKTATTEADLQRALSRAAVLISTLIDLVKQRPGTVTEVSPFDAGVPA